MGGIRVLVTRPQPGADRTAARLAGIGYEPVVLPLTQTVALAHDLPEAKPDLVVATSPQAFNHLSEGLRVALARVPVIVTGDGTATAARDAGLTDIKTAGGNVSSLIDVIGSSDLSDASVLYLAGRVRRPDLELYLQVKAAKLRLIEVYDTVSVSYSTDKLIEVALGGSFACVFLTSVETVVALAEPACVEFMQAIDNSTYICLSERIAEAVRYRFKNSISVAPEPTEVALLQCLMKAFPLA